MTVRVLLITIAMLITGAIQACINKRRTSHKDTDYCYQE
jgi:hypothetical protein